MPVVKLPVCGRASSTEEQYCPSFQMNYDLCNSTSFASKDSKSTKCHLIEKGGKRLIFLQSVKLKGKHLCQGLFNKMAGYMQLYYKKNPAVIFL